MQVQVGAYTGTGALSRASGDRVSRAWLQRHLVGKKLAEHTAAQVVVLADMTVGMQEVDKAAKPATGTADGQPEEAGCTAASRAAAACCSRSLRQAVEVWEEDSQPASCAYCWVAAACCLLLVHDTLALLNTTVPMLDLTGCMTR
jgi:hypothetical protein